MSEIASTILKQMGGSSRLNAMIGATGFLSIKNGNGVSFRFKGSKIANYVEITLNSLDTYTVRFVKIRGTEVKEVKTEPIVYCDGLKPLFERTTNLYLTL
jgi:hypothetical protein